MNIAPRAIVLAAFLITAPAYAIDKSHCGPNGFSPPAPQWVCEMPDEPAPARSVPEPGTYLLIVIGLLAIRLTTARVRS